MRTSGADPSLCIYCRRERPPSREHVLPASLGGDLTTLDKSTATPIVCQDCNRGFSAIEQALCEHSFVSLRRVVQTDPARVEAKLGGEHFQHDDGNDIWLDIEILNHLRPRVLPQLHLRDRNVMFRGDSDTDVERFISLLEKRRRTNRLAATYIKIGPAEFTASTRLVQHRDEDLYVRSATKEDGAALLAKIDSHWSEIAGALRTGPRRTTVHEHVQIKFNMHLQLENTYRAIAKIAFNFMAAKKGGLFALQREFDPIRAYIRGTLLPQARSTTSDEILLGNEFVRQLPHEQDAPIPTDSHMLTLIYRRPVVLVVVTLYKTVTFVVRLGELLEGGAFLVAHEFSGNRTGNIELPDEDLFRRTRQRTYTP